MMADIKMRITLSLQHDEWGFLHLLKSLLSIVDPRSSPQVGYNEIIEGMVAYVAFSVSRNRHLLNDFMGGDNSVRMKERQSGTNFSSAHNGTETTEIRELNPVLWSGHHLLPNATREGSLQFKFERWAEPSVFPKGNYSLYLNADGIRVVGYLHETGNMGESEMNSTAPLILHRCIRFVLVDPFSAIDFFENAVVSNLYSMPVWFPYRDLVLRSLPGGLEGTSLITGRWSSELRDRGMPDLEHLKRDGVIYLEFVKDFLGKGLPLGRDDLAALRREYWSRMGFNFLSVVVNSGIASEILLSPDLWIDDFLLDPAKRDAASPFTEEFHRSVLKLMDVDLLINRNSSRALFNELMKLDFADFRKHYENLNRDLPDGSRTTGEG